MKRYLSLLAMMILCVCVFTGCQCSHEWTEADCITPKTCTKCEETEGEALGHNWEEATCTAPKTCTVCGLSEGEAQAHVWTEVSCAAPKTCEGCGLTEAKHWSIPGWKQTIRPPRPAAFAQPQKERPGLLHLKKWGSAST